MPHLSLVPLQTAQLGPAGASFALNYGSGPIPRDGVTLQLLGFVTTNVTYPSPIVPRPLSGYALDYGDPLTGSAGVTEIRTAVQKYKSPADARRGLTFWRNSDPYLNWYSSSVLPVTATWLKRPAVGRHGFASLLTFAAANLNPIVRLHEQVTDGRYLLDLTVTAGSTSAAEQAAPGLLRTLDHRLHRVLGGHPAGTPAKLPKPPDPGQAQGGADLSAATLQPSDVGQSHWVRLFQDYHADPFALSAYYMDAYPAGAYTQLNQDIAWWPSATEATYADAYQGAFYDGLDALALGGSITPVDLSALSDPANGVLITGSGQSFVLINLTRGQGDDRVSAYSDTTLTTSDVQNLAQAAANRLDAALP